MNIGLVGSLANGIETYDGQTIKARNYLYLLSNKYGKQNVISVDTYSWKRHPFKCFWECFKLASKCNVIIILPGKRGIRIIIPLFSFLKKLYNYHIYYPVVGGWLPDELKNRPMLLKCTKQFDAVYVETKHMLHNLTLLGLNNAYYSPIFSLRKTLSSDKLNTNEFKKPYPLCTFSRVTETKGIGEAIDAVNKINSKHNDPVCTLDIFGMLDKNYVNILKEKIDTSKGYVKYCGIIKGENVIPTLAEHYLLIFPTYYPGEGFPGTLLESMMAGLPAVVSNWRYNSELVINQKTGVLFELGNIENLIKSIELLLNDNKKVEEMRRYCLEECKKYTAESIMSHLYSQIDNIKEDQQ